MKASKRIKGKVSKIIMFQMSLIFLFFIQSTKEEFIECPAIRDQTECDSDSQCTYDSVNKICKYKPCNEISKDVCSDSGRCLENSGHCIPDCDKVIRFGLEFCRSLHSIGDCEVDFFDPTKPRCKAFTCSNQRKESCLENYGCKWENEKCEEIQCSGLEEKLCLEKHYGSCSYNSESGCHKKQEKTCEDLGTTEPECNWNSGILADGTPCILNKSSSKCEKLKCSDINTEGDENFCYLKRFGNLKCGFTSGNTCSDYTPPENPTKCSDIKQETDCVSSNLNCKWTLAPEDVPSGRRRNLANIYVCSERNCEDSYYKEACEDKSHEGDFCKWGKKEGTNEESCFKKTCQDITDKTICEDSKLKGECFFYNDGEKDKCDAIENFKKCSDLGTQAICENEKSKSICTWKGGDENTCQEKECSVFAQTDCENEKLGGKCKWNTDLSPAECVKKVTKCSDWNGEGNKKYCEAEKSIGKGCYFDSTNNECKENTCSLNCEFCSDDECQLNKKCFLNSEATEGSQKCRDKTCADYGKNENECKAAKENILKDCHWDKDEGCLELNCNKYCEDCTNEQCPNSSAGCELKKEGTEEKCFKNEASCSDYNNKKEDCLAAKSSETKLDCFYEESTKNCIIRNCNGNCEHCTREECSTSSAGCELKKEGTEEKCFKKEASCSDYNNKKEDCLAAKSSETKLDCFYEESTKNCIIRNCNGNCEHCTKEECSTSSAGCFLKDNKCLKNVCTVPHMEGDSSDNCKCSSPYKTITTNKGEKKCSKIKKLNLILKVE